MLLFKQLRFVLNAYLAYLIFLLGKKGTNVWLIGGHNGVLYADNARVFYEYVRISQPNIKILWVANRHSPAWEKVKGEKVVKGSVSSYLALYRSRVALFSDSFNSDIAPLAMVLPFIQSRYSACFKVYLSHGSIAFKRMSSSGEIKSKLNKRAFSSYDLGIAATQLEVQAMEGYGIKKSRIVLAGSARHDQLQSSDNSGENIILIAPTWREWLFNDHAITKSLFHSHYAELLANLTLNQFLSSTNTKIVFYLHHMFQKYRNEFLEYETELVSIASPRTDISLLIRQAKLLITDYSSVSSDFYYMRKPIHFFHFDRDEYLSNTGSEIDLKNDIFGDVSTSADELVLNLIDTASRGYPLPSMQRQGEKYFVDYVDKENCSRIFQAINERL